MFCPALMVKQKLQQNIEVRSEHLGAKKSGSVNARIESS